MRTGEHFRRLVGGLACLCLIPLLGGCGVQQDEAPADNTLGHAAQAATAPAWWNAAVTYQYQTSSWWDDSDMGSITSSTQIQLRHNSKLTASLIEPWGWQPEFVDQVTGQTFRFLHLRPQAMYTTSVGTVYAAGTIVGLSGGDTCDTGYCSNGTCPKYGGGTGTCTTTYSTGAHLCLNTPEAYRTAFPIDNPTWSCANSSYNGQQLWTCNSQDNNLYECNSSGSVVKTTCTRGCFSNGLGKNDLCASAASSWSCGSSTYNGAQYWTCSGGKLYRCDGVGPIVVSCPNGCTSQALGTNDTCN